MLKTQLLCKLRHHEVSKVATMINDDRLWDSKLCDYVIENEKCCTFSHIVECRHRRGPFRERIHGYDNVSMPPGRVTVIGHEIDTPFSERSNGNYRV
jgi:hypothetical protein